jgi:hypothetical protein
MGCKLCRSNNRRAWLGKGKDSNMGARNRSWLAPARASKLQYPVDPRQIYTCRVRRADDRVCDAERRNGW